MWNFLAGTAFAVGVMIISSSVYNHFKTRKARRAIQGLVDNMNKVERS